MELVKEALFFKCGSHPQDSAGVGLGRDLGFCGFEKACRCFWCTDKVVRPGAASSHYFLIERKTSLSDGRHVLSFPTCK